MSFSIAKNKKARETKNMGPLRLPNEEEINTAYDKRKKAVVALFFETFTKKAERIQKVEDLKWLTKFGHEKGQK